MEEWGSSGRLEKREMHAGHFLDARRGGEATWRSKERLAQDEERKERSMLWA